jgi:membrane peptidoglycan carboxypeptidase
MSKAERERNSLPPADAGPGSAASQSAAVEASVSDRPRRGGRRWLIAAGSVLLVALSVLTLLVVRETQASTAQARYFSRVATELGYALGPGPSPSIRFPGEGPFDQRFGYASIPAFVERLEGRGFEVAEQARVSVRFSELMDRGLFPIYREKEQGGLRLYDRDGQLFHSSPHPARIYTHFDSIPEILRASLIFIENREFLDPRYPSKNPAVEWDRLGRGVLEMGLRKLGRERNVPGGSTLATQLEKFRHSPEGRTSSPTAKLQQIASASLRAYLDGPETVEAQKTILLAYLNSVPLAGQRGHGEVTGTADGLWAWYGTDFEYANRLLRGRDVAEEEAGARATVYRQALSLLIAHRRPSYYLAQETGRQELETLTDEHLRLLARENVIDPALAEGALQARIQVLPRSPDLPRVPFVERKAANQVRTDLLALTGAPQLYELDRLDLNVGTTLDLSWQESVADLFRQAADPAYLRAHGFGDTRLLDRGDPARVIYTFTLLETTPLGNVVRIQTDSYDGPLNLSEGGRLELGSTAKLRTLASYLEAVEELHQRLSLLPGDSLRRWPVAPQDRLTRWAVDFLRARPGVSLEAMLRAAMERQYSANPAERFATGGGVQTFSNFDNTYDQRVMSVKEAFRLSVNLPSVRTMRDVVQYHMHRHPRTTAQILQNVDDPGRTEYLQRFADDEGSRFLRQFYAKYRDRSGPELLDLLVADRDLLPVRMAWAFRTVAPDASVERFTEFLTTHSPNSSLTPGAASDLYRTTDPTPHPLQDLGYLARIHPLELWLVGYLLKTPGAGLQEVLAESAQARQDVYGWLFRTRSRDAQDTRIRTMIELEVFEDIHRQWQRLGYPFNNIVASLGTAIGSSGDRPLALAELMGIIVNGGIRYPVVRVEELHFAAGTPFETRMRVIPREGERVMSREVAAALRDALVDVVENGTARRVRGVLTAADGTPLEIGGKTGTGDNRFRVYAPGGRLMESRAVNRTATFTFFAGDRYFGVITAYVPGTEADAFRFTSGLPAQILRLLGPELDGMLAPAPNEGGSAADGGAPL